MKTAVIISAAVAVVSFGAARAILQPATIAVEPPIVPTGMSGSDSAPGHFGFGRAATPAEIARIDLDVRADGRGLPPGEGTVAAGARLYAAKCVLCHGKNGEGIRDGRTQLGPALVGRNPGDAFDFNKSQQKEGTKTIGNYWPYATTIFDYVRRAMPFDKPGSLDNEQVYALTAYLLYRNQIIGENAVINATTLPKVQMPSRNKFVRDDRETSTRVR